MHKLSQAVPFTDIALSPQIQRAVQEMNYTEATRIQAAIIPYLLRGDDVIGKSSTGSGKTAAFGIPAVEGVDGALKRPQVLVITPTRELCLQIVREMQKYAKYKEGVSVVAVYGGESITEQIRSLRYANVVVGTPGRLMDHLRRKTLKTADLNMVVLDEADEMLSMGFIEDIQTILAQTPDSRQTALFSATMPAPILEIAANFLTDPQIVDVIDGVQQKPAITQTYYYVPSDKKADALVLLLKYANAQRCMVFCNTKLMVDELTEKLSSHGFLATGLHGDMSQPTRSQVMQGFRSGRIQILVATDVAARGIDVDDIDIVINYDLPPSFEYYVHRIGRTGRAGKTGLSQTLICNNRQASQIRQLIHFTGTQIVERYLPTSADMMRQAVEQKTLELQKQLQAPAGKAAHMLVQRLQEGNGDTPAPDAEQLALALAEQLLGGDANYALPAGLKGRFGKKPKQPGQGATKKSTGKAKGIVSVTASIGRNAHIAPGHLLAAVTEVLDIPGSEIGKISIQQDSSTIDMSEANAKALVAYAKPIRVQKTPVSFTLKASTKKPAKETNYAAPTQPDKRRSGKRNAGPKTRARS